jgi:MoaA/NifB/PqqE/SkfB family radical SAM enzyme
MREPLQLPTMQYRDFSRAVHDRAASQNRVIKAQLELTYRCNLHCRHCYTDPYNSPAYFPRELSTAEILRLLDEMQQLGIIWLNLTGGDIFMHPDFFDIYEAAYRKGFLLQLYTNGTLFTRGLIERLEKMPPFTIDISCHSVDEARFDWFTQVPGSFRAFLRGIDLLKHSRLPYCFKTKAMTWNVDELPVIEAFVESHNQRFSCTTTLSPRLNNDCSPLDFRLPPDTIVNLEWQGRELLSDEQTCQAAQPPDNRLYRCGCGTDTIHINAWGELGTCTMEYEHRVSLRTHSLSDAIPTLFAAVRGRRYQTESACGTCQVTSLCDKKPTDARRECGSPEAPIPYACDLAIARAGRLGLHVISPLSEPHVREDLS